MYFFLLISLLLPSHSFAGRVLPRDWVYIVYDAGPGNVFASGIPAGRGQERSILAHINGESCRVNGPGYATRFTSLTSDLRLAQRIAGEQARTTGRDTYVYQIRGSQNIYSLENTLAYMLTTTPSLRARIHPHILLSVSEQHEFVTQEPIPASTIRRVFEYRGVMLPEDRPNQHFNAGYQETLGVTNDANFAENIMTSPSAAEIADSVQPPLYINSIRGRITACFMNMLCPRNRIDINPPPLALTDIRPHTLQPQAYPGDEILRNCTPISDAAVELVLDAAEL